MKKIFIIFLILFIPTICLAGTDDSGLQTFILDGNKMQGFTSFSAQQEDFFSSSKCLNVYNDGAELLTMPVKRVLSWINSDTTPVWTTNTLINISNFVDPLFVSIIGGATSELFITDLTTLSTIEVNFAKKNTPTTTKSLSCRPGPFKLFINPKVPSSYNKNIIIFAGGLGIFDIDYTSLVTYNKGYYYDNNLFYNQVPTDAEEWNGRLFVGAQNYIYYSTTEDYRDFTISSTGGGVIRMPDFSIIYNIVKTTNGLLIATNTGIWLLSGDILPSSWSLIKTINLTIQNSGAAVSYASNVFLFANNKLYLISNAIDLQELFEFSSLDSTMPPSNISATINNLSLINNHLWFCGQNGYDRCSGFYDIASKTVYFASSFETICNEYAAKHFLNELIIYKTQSNGSYVNVFPFIYRRTNRNYVMGYMLEPCIYITKNLTFNGKQNYKKIKRIEIDCAFENVENYSDESYSFSYEFFKFNYDIYYNNLFKNNSTTYLPHDSKLKIITYVNNSNLGITKTISNYNREYPDNDSSLLSNFLTGISPITNNQQYYPIKTYAINTLDIPAATTFKFHFEANGYLAIKQIRIYYYNYGNYKFYGR